MPKTTKFSELRAQMSPEARAEARRLADEDLKEMPLHELRAARHLTQQQLAKSLDMTQAAVSQLEQRTDVYLSTLENFVEAMGGRLEMYAVFPDGKVSWVWSARAWRTWKSRRCCMTSGKSASRMRF